MLYKIQKQVSTSYDAIGKPNCLPAVSVSLSVGVGSMFESVCLSVCLFVQSITQK